MISLYNPILEACSRNQGAILVRHGDRAAMLENLSFCFTVFVCKLQCQLRFFREVQRFTISTNRFLITFLN